MTKEEFYKVAKAYIDFYNEVERWLEFGIDLYTSKLETNFYVVFNTLVGKDFDYDSLLNGDIEEAWKNYDSRRTKE